MELFKYLTSKTIWPYKTFNNERFVYDSYRRLIMMYADVVMEKSKVTIEGGIRYQLELIVKKKRKHY